MRVFLNNTGFDSAGAIALAEYLPDFQSVIHLDVTENAELSIAGVMALAAAIKLNPILRCLDLSIPPNDSEFARLSQDILQACVRNTELAQTRSNMRGAKEVATPIYKSELAREIKELEVSSSRALHAAFPSELQALVDTARHCINTLTTALPRDEALVKEGQLPIGRYAVHAERTQAQNVQMQLSEAVVTMQGSSDRGAKDALGSLCAHLAILSQRAINLYGFEDEAGNDLRLLTSAGGSLLSPHSPIRSPASPSHQISSPSFSITDSDSSDCDSSEEEVQEQSHSPSDPTDSSIFGGIPKVSGLQAISRQEPPPSLNLPSPTLTEPSPSKPSPRSPVENHSRTLTLEEGEVFRRGISKIGEDDDRTLLDVLDGQSGIDGEELKQEILETEVERPRRSSPCVADHEQNGSHDA